MTTALDTILSGRGETAPQPGATEQANTAPERTTETAPEQTTEGQQTEGQSGTVKTVPHEALHAEKQKVKRYTEEVSSLRQEIASRDQAWERRIAQLLEKQQPKEQAPDWFADPDAAFQQNLQRNLSPVLQQHAQALQQTREFVSRQFAEQKHGAETVNAAFQELERRLQTDPSAQATYQQIMGSGDPWGSLATWYKRETFLSEAGTDPEAYKAKLKQELLAELQQGNGGTQQTQARPAQVMPSNLTTARNVGSRTGPAWSGPTPLADIFKRK